MRDLFLLFASSFVAATLLPAQSELVLGGLHLSGQYSVILLVAVATAGNVLGACVNWLLGRYCLRFKHRRWFPVPPPKLDRAAAAYQRYGIWTLLFSWLPIVGDPLTLVAGMAHTPFLRFLALVTLGKAARYVAIVALLT